MSPRPRKVSDDEIFGAATRAMSRLGPAQLTLADIGAEAGLTAGALVQRFGSKRGLLLSLMERFAHGTREMFVALRAADPSPLATIYAYGECMARLGPSPDEFARQLSWLQQDLTDPDFRRFTLIQARASRRELQRLVDEAIAARELVRTADAVALARAIEVTVGGSLMAWAIYQEGAATNWIRQDLDTLLAAYRPRRPRRAQKK